jgi:hypothetical protein
MGIRYRKGNNMYTFIKSMFKQLPITGFILLLFGGCTPPSAEEIAAKHGRYLNRDGIGALATPTIFLFPNAPNDNGRSVFPQTQTSTAGAKRFGAGKYSRGTSGIYIDYQNSPFIPLKANLFGTSTSVTLKYASPQKGWPSVLSDITFNDIQNQNTGQLGLSLTDIVEPEVFAKDYADLNQLYPILYNSADNLVLFGRIEGPGEYHGNIFLRYLKLDDGSIHSVFPPYKNEASKKAIRSGYHTSHLGPSAYLFMEKIGVDKFIFMERYGKQRYGRDNKYYYKNISISLLDYINNVVIDQIDIKQSMPKSGDHYSVGDIDVFKLFNIFSIRPNIPYGESYKVYSLDPRSDDEGRPSSYQPPDKVTNDGEYWFYLLSDNFTDNYDETKSPGFTEKQSITFGYISEAGFKLEYDLKSSTQNHELFEFMVPSSQFAGGIRYMYDLKDLKISNGLLHIKDSYGSVYVFNLEKNGIRERKIPSLKIKNNQLSKEELSYLSVFNY